MFSNLIEKLIILIFQLLPPELLRSTLNDLLTSLENEIKKTTTPVDDWLALPVIKRIRVELKIPRDHG